MTIVSWLPSYVPLIICGSFSVLICVEVLWAMDGLFYVPSGVGRGRVMLSSYSILDVQLIALRGLYNAKLCGHSNSKL